MHGSSEIYSLLLHYGVSNGTNSGVEVEPLRNGEELKKWVEFLFREAIFFNFKHSSIKEWRKDCSNPKKAGAVSPNAEIAYISTNIAVYSINCEHSFSKHNLINRVQIRYKELLDLTTTLRPNASSLLITTC